ncbi:hypothetical protein K435DRAFT_853171 [Dendrothele bispora CBS 962.96]|uniref:Alpha/beta-hydrolase n=1 Tax=Dendrothele bispora (strain CBS 962.96) TaxID=1314807 RepID=A0A4V4HHA8_DENBC|nr:hypothetical protein K435DRAFT_853171 [Dendrothele bispora CBS 962.96]
MPLKRVVQYAIGVQSHVLAHLIIIQQIWPFDRLDKIPQAQDGWTFSGATTSLSGSVAASSTVNLTASVENFKGKNGDRKLFSTLDEGKGKKVFLELQSGRGLITLSVFLTLPQNKQALNYTNPLLVVTGDRDYFMCGGNCNVTDGDFPSRPAAVAGLFPAVNNFTVYIPENTGHFVNYHFSAPQTFTFIQEWIGNAF